MDRFVHANTDGPANPYARVYDFTDIKRDFPNFRVVGMHKEFMHAPAAAGSPPSRWQSDGVAPLGRDGTDHPTELERPTLSERTRRQADGA